MINIIKNLNELYPGSDITYGNMFMLNFKIVKHISKMWQPGVARIKAHQSFAGLNYENKLFYPFAGLNYENKLSFKNYLNGV